MLPVSSTPLPRTFTTHSFKGTSPPSSCLSLRNSRTDDSMVSLRHARSEAGQRTVANDDAVPGYIPESANYTHTLQGFHVYGENATYGMSVSLPLFAPFALST